MLQGHDKKHGIFLGGDQGIMRGTDIMRFEFGKTQSEQL